MIEFIIKIKPSVFLSTEGNKAFRYMKVSNF